MEPPTTLLSQRTSGPPTDIRNAMGMLQYQLRPPAMHIPNLPSVLDALGSRMSPPRSTSPYEHVYNSPPQASPAPPRHTAYRQLPYSSAQPRPSSRTTPTRTSGRVPSRSASHTDPRALGRGGTDPIKPARAITMTTTSTTAAPARSARTPPRRRGVERASRTGLNESSGRDTSVGTVSAGEQTRCRKDVARKLLDLYEELRELCECRDKMSYQVAEAMCVDPRRAKEVRGVVSVLAEPPSEQRAALDQLLQALDDAHAASIEVVAAYLTPEEKRFLGVNTHLFQTRAEKATTYQYAPPRARHGTPAKKTKQTSEPSAEPSEQSAEPSEASAEPSEASAPPTAAEASLVSSSHASSHRAKKPPSAAPTWSMPPTQVAEPTAAVASSRTSADRRASGPGSSTASVTKPHASKTSAASSSRASAAPPAELPTPEEAPAVLLRAGVSDYSSPAYSPAGGQQSVEEPRSPAVVASEAAPLAPLRFNIKQFAIDSSTSTTERDVTPERAYQPKLSASTLGGSSRASVDSPRHPPQAPAAPVVPVAAMAASVSLPVAAPSAPLSVAPPWTVSTASTGTTAAAPAAPASAATPPPLPSAPKVSTTRAEFKRFVIDSDSDSSLL